jgi:hypothetical protein
MCKPGVRIERRKKVKSLNIVVCFSVLCMLTASIHGDEVKGGEIQVLKSNHQNGPVGEMVDQYQKRPQVKYNSAITLLDEGFESGSAPGWTAYDNDGDGEGWSVYSESANPGFEIAHSGDFGAGILYNPAGNDDWLITPSMVLPADSSVAFEFWANSQDPSYLEDFNVKVSTTGFEIVDFTNLVAEVRSVPDDWTQYSYDLSSFAGDTIYVAVQCVSVDEFYLFVDDFLCTASSVGIGEDPPHAMVPRGFNLHQNYPNPFNPSTTITIDIPGVSGEKQHVEVTIYDIRGRRVKTLVDSDLESGNHRIHWNGRNEKGESASSGIYLYTLKTQKETFTRKMTVLK